MLRRRHMYLLAITVSGCATESIDPSEWSAKGAARASFSISDAPRGGDPRFFWLPPLVPPPNFNGTFDATRSPTVRICEWAGEECAAILGLFTGSQVRIDVTGEFYEAVWRAKDAQLDPAGSYRMETFDGPDLLGYADLAVVTKGKQKKAVDPTQFVVVPTSGTLTIRFRIETAPANQSPVVISPSSAVTDEDVPFTFVGTLAISDADSPLQTVTLEGTNGTVTLSGTTALDFVAGDGTSDAYTVFQGPTASINAALNMLSFEPDADFNGSAQLAIQTNDGSLSDQAIVPIDVAPINDAPLIDSSDGCKNLTTNTVRTIKLSINDVDVTSLQQVEVTMAVDGGATLDLPTQTALTFLVGAGQQDTRMVFRGTLASINSALNGTSGGVEQTPQTGFVGAVTLTVQVDDLGNSGAGGPQTTSRSWRTNYANAFVDPESCT